MYAPHLLPKVRSEAIMSGVRGYPCTLRISNFIPGHRCAGHGTVVGCHTGSLGKGKSTKTSDLEIVAACVNCHALLDMVDPRWFDILESDPVGVLKRIMTAGAETRAMLIRDGVIVVPDANLI